MAFDDDNLELANGMADAGSGWSWVSMSNYLGQMKKHFAAGPHRLTIVGREDGCKIDVVKISTSRMVPDPGQLKPDAVGIRSMHNEQCTMNSGVYDLLGRPAPSAHGVRIVAGRKHIYK